MDTRLVTLGLLACAAVTALATAPSTVNQSQYTMPSLKQGYLDDPASMLHIDWFSSQDAIERLNESQAYIEKHFTSDEIIFQPRGTTFKHIVIKKKDWQGRVCAYDLRYRNYPEYRPPFTEITYTITDDALIQHPSTGDHFQGCFLSLNHQVAKDIIEPLSHFSNWHNLVGCSLTGCTRNDLNGFSIEDFDDNGDREYRTAAMNFDSRTKLLMEKVQGLGFSEYIQHSNRAEILWFTYPQSDDHYINYHGIWQQTQYHGQTITQSCLLISHQQVLRLPLSTKTCPTNPSLYTLDVTWEYGDMWWIDNPTPKADLAQMNVMVRWSQALTDINYTTWEYLPAGKAWAQGILYRYQQDVHRNLDGSDSIETHTISEFVKVNKDV
ncbi:chromosome partitioning protein ParA [Vibrio parahaemolyticus]|nr:chromosome partitioning protein ParA [Vibrio parahaemolyticus]